ncbi:hypothetical protein STCU_11293 [Strigomonas culicis]|uniref:Uncharacterized protein n=1 Tax=Strigomonas culicis TaxID=28005 RepID=S9TED0_9TRYP|nr:hypothetical protein STCU_11293 [Strigomonas culicis]|eukprot:EPY16412.1 hypothetical protein STCU_11293 [Strigomonas culicis]
MAGAGAEVAVDVVDGQQPEVPDEPPVEFFEEHLQLNHIHYMEEASLLQDAYLYTSIHIICFIIICIIRRVFLILKR